MKKSEYTRQFFVREYRELKRQLGRQPTCIEFAERYQSVSQLSLILGNPGWRNLVIAAGDKPRGTVQVTREQAVEAYRDLKKRLQRRPTLFEYAARCYSRATLQKIFKTRIWNSLITAAGERPRLASNVTRAMLIADYQALKKKLGRQPFLADYQRECYNPGIVTSKFGRGAWRKLQVAAGDQPLTMSNIPGKHLIQDYLNLQEKLGRRPKLIEYTYQCHTPKVLDRVFGKPGWGKLIEAVGSKALPKNLITAEQLIRKYDDTKKALGREPTQWEFYRRHHHTTKVYDRVFGRPGWSNLKKAASRRS